jgi:inosose dehydratase
MKIGYHTLTWSNYYNDYDINEVIERIKELEFKGIEFIEPISKLGKLNSLQDALNKTNLQVASISCGLNMDPEDAADIDETKMRIEFAEKLGVRDVMLCGGWLSDSVKKNKSSYEILANKLNVCCEHAAKFGMNIAFHPHKDTIVEVKKDIAELLQFTNRLKLCLDVAHLAACGSDPAEVISLYRDITTYIHLKDWDVEKDDFVELGEGEVDIPRCLSVLKEIRYNGWIVVELDRTTRRPKESARMNADYLKRIGLL